MSSWSSRPAMPRRGLFPTAISAISLRKTESPIRRRQHRIPDIVHRTDESDAADDRGLLADVDGIAAHIDVAVAQGLQNLWQREAKGDELVAVDLDFKCFGLAAPAGHVDDSWHRAKSARQDPILERLQVHHAVTRWPDELITINFAGRAPGR